MQGYFQVSPLPVESSSAAAPTGTDVSAATEAAESPKTEAHLLIISRRSKERAGLRYQRRGVNDDGQVANFVETEQILCVRRAGQVHLLSFLQFRGSIPLFWSQSPFSLKPPPVLERSTPDNAAACAKHFDAQVQRFGKVTCINLAEQSGKEGQLTEAYKQRVSELEREDGMVRYVAFDFHKECAGMKFENVSKLIENVEDTIKEMGFYHRSTTSGSASGEQASASASPTGAVQQTQSGAFRVSCLDCLDRTNVVQSAFARHVLAVQLDRLGVAHSSLAGKDEKFDFIFNDT